MNDKDFDIKNGILEKYNGKESHVVIPKRVTEIGGDVFFGCDNLKNIEIPNSVTSIGSSAFGWCSSLASINIPNSVISIWECAFRGCKRLTNIKIPKGVTQIKDGMFADCSCLASINIPNMVTYIGYNAFDGIKEVKPQYNSNGSLRAFKGFWSDWTCRNFQYEVGKSFHQDGNIFCCSKGFHACTNPLSVFNHYAGYLSNLHFAEVELSGTMDFDDYDSKVAASDIRIIRELSVSELVEIYNSMEKV